MKKLVYGLSSFCFLSLSAQANIDPVEVAKDRGISNCDNLITKTFSYFGDYKNTDNHLETNYSSSPDGSTKTVRYYFNLGFDERDHILGDVIIISTGDSCTSYTNMSFIEPNVSCDDIRSQGDWREIETQNNFNWLKSSGVSALFYEYNNGNSCKVNFYKSDVSYE